MHDVRTQLHLKATERGHLIAQEMRRDNLTLEQMGQRLGLTRERVRQLLAKAGETWRKGTYQAHRTEWPEFIVTCTYCERPYVEGALGHRGRADERKMAKAWAEEQGMEFGVLAHCRAAGHPNPRRSYIYASRMAADDYQAGMSVDELMEKYHFEHREAIYQHLKRWKIKPRYERGDPFRRPIGRDMELQRQLAEELREHGRAGDIAKRYGVSPDRIRQIGDKFGVPRPRSKIVGVRGHAR